jgi:hypothetical protein
MKKQRVLNNKLDGTKSPIQQKKRDVTPVSQPVNTKLSQQTFQSSRKLNPGTLLHLQRSAGNQAVGQILAQKESGSNKQPVKQSIQTTAIQRTPEGDKPKIAPAVPVRWYKLWYEGAKQRDKFKKSYLTLDAIAKKGGGAEAKLEKSWIFFKKKDKQYGKLLEKVAAYQKMVANYHANMEAAPEKFKQQTEMVEQIRAIAQQWTKKHSRWGKGKPGARKDRFDAVSNVEQLANIERSQRLDQIRPWVTTRSVSEQKDDKGKRHGGHVLEKVDPQHRDFQTLQMLYKVYESENKRVEFFPWVDHLERSQDNRLLEVLHKRHNQPGGQCVWGIKEPDFSKWKDKFLEHKRSVGEPLIERTQYLKEKQAGTEKENKETPKELQRETLELTFEGSAIYKGGSRLSSSAKEIFVMSPEGRFYSFPETTQTTRFFHHSSLLAGM